MNNYENIKNMTIDEMGHYLCESMDDLESDYPCEQCPMNGKCTVGVNGWIEWLREAKK